MGAHLVMTGTAHHAPTPHDLEVLADVAIVVDAEGTIVAIHPVGSLEADDALAGATTVHRLASHERLLPGLIDLHIHAPQWPQLGTGLDLTLERWLFEHTFPLEARYADPAFADDVWSHMVPTLLAHGTTTAVYFASIHEEATLQLAKTCLEHGQRAYVGRVAMDHPQGTPEWYRDADATAGIEASRRSIEAVRALAGEADLVQPIVTPRFVPACSDDLLTGLGRLAVETGTLIQTHCSESDWEHGAVLERCGITDTQVLAGHGLLRAGTVLAHGNHLGDDDFASIAAAQAGVACCPLSNAYFANGVFPIARALRAGVRVGLGTDVAGGAEPGLLPQAAFAVTASRMLRDGVDVGRSSDERGTPGTAIDTVTAFHLATAGGADVLGAPLGRFAIGCQLDAIVVDTSGARSALHRWAEVDTEARLFEKIVRLAGSSDITSVWVAGSRVRLPG